MVFEVEGINTDNQPFSEEEYGQRPNRTFGLMRLPRRCPLLLGRDKVDNRSLNFIQAWANTSPAPRSISAPASGRG